MIPFEHSNPIQLLAVANLALSKRDRLAAIDALQAIDRATSEAEAGRPPTNGAQPWAPVE